jgi:hypothetical protein
MEGVRLPEEACKNVIIGCVESSKSRAAKHNNVFSTWTAEEWRQTLPDAPATAKSRITRFTTEYLLRRVMTCSHDWTALRSPSLETPLQKRE